MANLKLSSLKTKSTIDKGIYQIIERALRTGVSDIHIEPGLRYSIIRYRRAGGLRIANKIPSNQVAELVKHLKLLAGLKETSAKPQTKDLNIEFENKQFLITISTLPLIDGEKVTIQIDMSQSISRDLRQLGLWGQSRRQIEHALSLEKGLVIISNQRQDHLTKSITSLLTKFENSPIKVALINQEELTLPPNIELFKASPKNGLSIANQLKTSLKRGFKVIGVSPVIDSSSASNIVKAVSLEHLILSGVLATDLSHALVNLRFLSKGSIGSVAVISGLYQRSVRGLCPSCREIYNLSSNQQQILIGLYDINKPSRSAYINELERIARNDLLEKDLPLTSSKNGITKLWQASIHGCKVCDYTGYSGSIDVVEVSEVSEIVRKHLINSDSAHDIYESLVSEGMIDMLTDGLIKALRGMIDLPTLLAFA